MNNDKLNWDKSWKLKSFQRFFKKISDKDTIRLSEIIYLDLKKHNIKTIAEIGSGVGSISFLLKIYKKEFEINLIDNSEEAFKYVDRMYPLFSIECNFYLGDIFDFKERTFDCVFSYGLVEHFKTRKERYEICQIHKRLLNKYGVAYIICPYEFSFKYLLMRFFKRRISRSWKIFEKGFTKKEFKNYFSNNLSLEFVYVGRWIVCKIRKFN